MAFTLAVAPSGCGKPQDAAAECGLSGPTCRKNVLAACDDAGVVVERACDPGRCALDAPVPQCVPAGALPCEPATDEPTCENGLLVSCPAEAAYRLATDCGAGQICSGRMEPPRCAPLGEEPCDPERFPPLCVNGRRVVCDGRRLAEDGRCAAVP